MSLKNLRALAAYHAAQAQRFGTDAKSFSEAGMTGPAHAADESARFHQDSAEQLRELAAAFEVFGHKAISN